MKIKMLEKVIHGGQVYHNAEVRIVSDEVGAYFCGKGWAEDAEGQIATGDRKPGAEALNVQDQLSAGE